MAMKEETVQEVKAPLPCGAVIQGRYFVEGLFGKGGFGAIYLVRDHHKKQELFVLAEVLNPNKESYRFTLEYVAPALLDHQILPHVQYVFNNDKLGRAYVLMSYIEEPALEILRLQQPEKRFPLPKVIAFMAPIINALNYLHHRNPPVIHQNINPTSIIVSQTLNSPVLIMLDLLKENDSTTTALPYFVPGYNAPEQYGEEISTRTDIYALGATCYTLLTGIIPPDAIYRSTQLSNGEVDPLKPPDEVIPTIPTHMNEAIRRAMSIHANDRFSSIQQFEQALLGDRRFQESPTLRLNGSLPKQALSPKADLVEQKPLEPMIAPTNTTQTNSVEQLSPEPFLVPTAPTFEQAPVFEVSPLLAVTEKLPKPEVVSSTVTNEELATPEATLEVAPSVSVTQKPPVSEEVTPAIADHESSAPVIISLPVVAEEQPVIEAVSSASTQSPVIPQKAVETPAESLPGQPPTMPSRKPDTLRPSSSRQTVEKPAAASVPKQRRAWKFAVLHIVLTLLIGFGISVILWSDIPIHPSAHAGVPTPGVSSTQTPPPASSIYPMLTGMYSGTIYDLSRNIGTSMLLTGMRQSQGNISGYLTLGPTLQGGGHFSGTIDTTKELKFVVTDTVGNTTMFFEGIMQSESNLTGDYYRCSSVGPVQGKQCKQVPGSYGIWDIVLFS